MPRLLQALLDAPTADGRLLVPKVLSGDSSCRRPFIPPVKAVLAAALDDAEWRR